MSIMNLCCCRRGWCEVEVFWEEIAWEVVALRTLATLDGEDALKVRDISETSMLALPGSNCTNARGKVVWQARVFRSSEICWHAVATRENHCIGGAYDYWLTCLVFDLQLPSLVGRSPCDAVWALLIAHLQVKASGSIPRFMWARNIRLFCVFSSCCSVVHKRFPRKWWKPRSLPTTRAARNPWCIRSPKPVPLRQPIKTLPSQEAGRCASALDCTTPWATSPQDHRP